MNTFLYLLRRPIDRIPAPLFLPTENAGDVVLIEAAATSSLRLEDGTAYVMDRERDAAEGLTYEDLVDKIFESERVIVI